MNVVTLNPNPLNVASSPHWRDGSSIARSQQVWLIALLPAMIASVWLFGFNSLRIIGMTVVCSVSFDALSNMVVPSKDKTANWSSVTMAVLLAFTMPYNAPWWLLVVGSFIMIVIGKKLFGGYGAYPVHPVLLSYAIMRVSWPQRFDFTASMVTIEWSQKMVEPLRLVKTLGSSMESAYYWKDLLLGRQVAGIGNGLVLYLLIGGIILLLARQITWHIPVAFIGGQLFMAGVLHLADPAQYASPWFYLLARGTVFAAFFLATEYTTSPVNRIPMLIYGFLGGVLLMLIRAFSIYVDGAAFAVLLINLCNPLLDRIAPKVKGVTEVSRA
ncbi:MAG: RnfABCDGE type electron transport complex subunit D [Candidatus Zixiibacteriota bacterium]